MSDVIAKVREMHKIKAQIAELTERKKELEKYFLERGGNDINDTKYKSVSYADPDSQASVTYTEAQSLTVTAPHYLADVLGDIFKDIFTEETKVEVKPKSKEIERMLIGMYTKDYIKLSPQEVIAQLPCSEKAKKVLSKRLKGANFDADRDNLIKIGELHTDDASDYAYMYAEAVVWQTCCKVCLMAGISAETLAKYIDLGVSVSDSTKIAVV